MVKHALEAIKRISNYSSKKKLALTVEQLSQACSFLDKNLSLKSLRMKVIMILSFAGFLRFSECQHIRRSDIKFFNDYAMIFIEKSKTDVYREGHWVLIARTNTDLRPILNLISYLNRIAINSLSDDFIFRGIVKSKQSQRLWKANAPISYSSIREHFVLTLKNIGLDSSLYGLHSLRSGGASAAANMGVEDRLIQKHGRWKTVGIKNKYISEDIDNLLFISRNLGL